jgi:hypothetical protein
MAKKRISDNPAELPAIERQLADFALRWHPGIKVH